jgi:hypothetical protein
MESIKDLKTKQKAIEKFISQCEMLIAKSGCSETQAQIIASMNIVPFKDFSMGSKVNLRLKGETLMEYDNRSLYNGRGAKYNNHISHGEIFVDFTSIAALKKFAKLVQDLYDCQVDCKCRYNDTIRTRGIKMLPQKQDDIDNFLADKCSGRFLSKTHRLSIIVDTPKF